MKKQYLIGLFIALSVIFPFVGAFQKNTSNIGLPNGIDDLYNLSNLIVRGSFVDLGADSDLVSIHVNETYKGESSEYVSIRRLELQNLAPIENDDCIIFLGPLGKIYTLTWGTCNVYYIEKGCVFNNVEHLNDSDSPFSANGMPLYEFITEYLER